MVEQARGDASGHGQILDGRGVDTLLGKDGERRVDQLVASSLGLAATARLKDIH